MRAWLTMPVSSGCCPLSLILLWKELLCTVEGPKVADLMVLGSHLLAVDVVLLAKSSHDLQLALEWFATYFEVAGMKMSNF